MGILHVLLRKEQVTAPCLAEKFEVSRRTIQRDIEDLCKAGFPIVTTQGVGGGISIQPEFKLDNRIFTPAELQAVVAGLRGVESVSAGEYAGKIRDKLSTNGAAAVETMRIDLASFYGDSLTEKICLLQRAITGRRVVSFRYYYNKGESLREIEPYLLSYQWGSWYVLGFCLERMGFRLFKLNRLWELRELEREYIPKEIPPDKLNPNDYHKGGIPLKAVFQPGMKFHLVEEYGPHNLEVRGDGKILFQWEFTNRDALVSWMLRFGDQAEVLEPQWLRRELYRQAERLVEKYRDAQSKT